jgi:predicted nucleic acid-binding protein
LRAPSTLLVVDAAILVAAARGRSSGAVLRANDTLHLATTERAIGEARRRIELGMKRPDLLPILHAITELMVIAKTDELAPTIPAAETGLREAVASRNGSARDAHVLALAWTADADIWTTDSDFAGTGVATWSTPNQMRALAEADARVCRRLRRRRQRWTPAASSS